MISFTIWKTKACYTQTVNTTWCLHCVSLPIINRHIRNWKNAWINHPLRTEQNKTPIQLWVTGLQSAGIFQGCDEDIQVCVLIQPVIILSLDDLLRLQNTLKW